MNGQKNETIQIFVTGGTFDKDYNFITGELYFKDSHLNDMMTRGRCIVPTDIKTLMMIDSLEMTDTERGIIAYNCRMSPHDNIVITHGTDTMVKTGQPKGVFISMNGRYFEVDKVKKNKSTGFFQAL